LIVDPSDPNRLWLRATYGLLTSADRGCKWHYICEAAPGYYGTEDPMLGVVADGALIGGLFRGLTTTRDHGCNWSLAGPMEGAYVVDLAVQPSDASRALAMASSGSADGSFTNQIYKSTDSALHWTQLGQDLDRELLLLTLDAAPSLPSRIYVTAIRTSTGDGGAGVREGVLVRSDNEGISWTTRPILGSTSGFEPWLSAVHPGDPNKLYVRLRGPDSGPEGLIENRVVYSADSGETWQQIFEARADILGFALSPDGSRVLLGLGDSREPSRARPVDGAVLGIYSASAQDHQFTRTRSGQIGCLTWSADGLYFCGAEYSIDGGRGFELGLSTDEGLTSKPVMHLAGIEGMLECPSDASTSAVCDESEWTPLCKDLGRCEFDSGSYIPYTPGETCSTGSGGTGAGADGGYGGSPGSGGVSDAGVSGGNAADAGLSVRGGCGVAARPLGGLAAGFLLALFALRARPRLRR
jgi:hypothetical protein